MSESQDKGGSARQKPKVDRDIEAVVKSMQDEFAGGLPERMSEIESAVESVLACSSAANLHQASMLAHKLYGTTGSYGFDEMSLAFRDLEQAIIAINIAIEETRLAGATSKCLPKEDPLLASLTSSLTTCKTLVDQAYENAVGQRSDNKSSSNQ